MLRYARASSEDQPRILQFLNQFPGDYLVHRLPSYLELQPGGVYLAWDGDELVGMAVIHLPRPHEAYLGGMRVAPARQGQGIGTEFTRFQLAEAERLGAWVVRALVQEGNAVSPHILQDKLGFRPSIHWHVGRYPGIQRLAEFTPEAGPAWAVDWDRLNRFWERRRTDLWAGRDLWMPYSWTAQDIRHHLEFGGVAIAPQDADQEVQALALFQIKNHEHLSLHYFYGERPHLDRLVGYLGSEARAWGVTELRYGLPEPSSRLLAQYFSEPPQDEWRGALFERELSLAKVHR
ncbi:MAG: GNAT family N-acetyltransferase [Firmicutes bacterium]|nr:GNAT family N-acetyltransferase [Alicyclobacillaceae bacterium]MCL6497662.1 GNAT family N-acetyltransferase [Bacillota bacterium]